jgi:hypothetical protein
MATQDRSVGLAELAARVQAGPQAHRAKSDCRNPECLNGMTPGLVASGGGTKGAPLFGAGGTGAKRLMKWAWVPCLACNTPADARKAGAVYRHLNLSDAQIAQRAQMANLRAAYQPPQSESLGKLAGARANHSPVTSSVDSGKLAELMEQNKQLNARLDELLKQNAEMTSTLSRMAMQVAALLEDNAKLRSTSNAAPEVRANDSPPPRNEVGT